MLSDKLWFFFCVTERVINKESDDDILIRLIKFRHSSHCISLGFHFILTCRHVFVLHHQQAYSSQSTKLHTGFATDLFVVFSLRFLKGRREELTRLNWPAIKSWLCFLGHRIKARASRTSKTVFFITLFIIWEISGMIIFKRSFKIRKQYYPS